VLGMTEAETLVEVNPASVVEVKGMLVLGGGDGSEDEGGGGGDEETGRIEVVVVVVVVVVVPIVVVVGTGCDVVLSTGKEDVLESTGNVEPLICLLFNNTCLVSNISFLNFYISGGMLF
jgi:hypothetical protein